MAVKPILNIIHMPVTKQLNCVHLIALYSTINGFPYSGFHFQIIIVCYRRNTQQICYADLEYYTHAGN